MAKNSNFTKSTLNPNILLNNEHEEKELKAIDKIAGMEQLDPEVSTLVEYNEKIFSNVCIVPLFDLHIGGEGTKLKRIKMVIDFIQHTANAVCVFGGDLLDNATLNGATNAHTSKLNPNRALDLAVELFEPIKDKVLCVLAGNHDGESGGRNKDSNMAPAKQFAKRLGVKYAPFNALIKINIPLKNAKHHKKDKIAYYVFATHGSGKTSSKAGTVDLAFNKAISACASLGVSPDLILSGHFHSNVDGVKEVKVPKFNEKGEIVSEITKSIRIESTSSMQQENTYAVANGMDLEKANISAINICWLKNPYYYEKTSKNEWQFWGQSTKFPILRQNDNKFTRIASEYQAKYCETEELEKRLREEYKDKNIGEITLDLTQN